MIKKLLLIVLSITFMTLAGCRNDWEWLASQPKPWRLAEDKASEILAEFQQRFPDFEKRLKAIALWRVGTPYEIFKLGEEIEPDPDPIIRLDVSDCTGHVLTSLALAQSANWAEARANMIEIHYKADRDGHKKPTYRSRWHYTADRVTANPYTVSFVEDLLPDNRLATAEIILNIKEDGEEFLDLDWQRPIKLKYIPSDQINRELLAQLPEVCVVSFVREQYYMLGIIFAHEGMIIDGKSLVHASQSAGETVILDFIDYYFPPEGPLFDGIVVSRFVPLK